MPLYPSLPYVKGTKGGFFVCLEICHSERSEESHTAQGEFDSRVGNDLRVVPRSFSRFYGRAMHAPTGLCEFVILSDSEESPTARSGFCVHVGRGLARAVFLFYAKSAVCSGDL